MDDTPNPSTAPADRVPFIKMHGLGNDFVILDRRSPAGGPGTAALDRLDESLVRRIADRRTGVGCDQLILLESARPELDRSDVVMRILNPDGSEAEACGNATRCVAALLDPDATGRDLVIVTAAGRLHAHRRADGLVTVDMGAPVFDWQAIPLSGPADTDALNLSGPLTTDHPPAAEASELPAPVAVSMGNPHCVFIVPDLDDLDPERLGPPVERHPLFPNRTNVEFAQILDRSRIRLRVWERGAGLTQACGSGACASAVAAMRRGLTERRVSVILDGGTLDIEWTEDGRVLMTGPVAHSFDGILTLAEPQAPPLCVGGAP